MASEPAARAAIEERLPHRPPFLFVDRIVEESPDAVVTEWDVPEDLPAFAGHFPGRPILPGVLITEHALQSAALAILTGGDSLGGGVPVLVRIDQARFRRPVRPGETLTTRAEITESAANARWCRAKVGCGGDTVARLAFTLAVARPEEGLAP